MSKVIIVRDPNGREVARISEDAYNLKPRIEEALRQGKGGSISVEEADVFFIDLVGMRPYGDGQASK